MSLYNKNELIASAPYAIIESEIIPEVHYGEKMLV